MKGKEDGTWRRGAWVSLAVFLLTLIYAVIRYHVLRDLPLSRLPLFTTNKAVALSSVLLIGSSFALGPLARLAPRAFAAHVPLRKPLGLIGFGAAGLHSLLSVILLSAGNYPRLFGPDGTLSLVGETTLLAGALAFLIFSVVAITSIPSVAEKLSPAGWKRAQRLGLLALALTLVHVALPAFPGWMKASSYAYGFVSISLLASLFIVLVFLLRLFAGVGGRGKANSR